MNNAHCCRLCLVSRPNAKVFRVGDDDVKSGRHSWMGKPSDPAQPSTGLTRRDHALKQCFATSENADLPERLHSECARRRCLAGLAWLGGHVQSLSPGRRLNSTTLARLHPHRNESSEIMAANGAMMPKYRSMLSSAQPTAITSPPGAIAKGFADDRRYRHGRLNLAAAPRPHGDFGRG